MPLTTNIYRGGNDSEFTLNSSAYTTDNEWNTLAIGTNLPNGWRIENIVDSTGTPITHWLKVSQSTSFSAGKTNVSLIFEENFSFLVRTGYIHIKAGNLHTELRVNQEGR